LDSKKSVIILGTGTTRGQCPYDTEVWGVNGVYSEVEILKKKKRFTRLDKLFITDTLWSPQGHIHFDIDRLNRIAKEYHTQVIMLHTLRLGKHTVEGIRYPFKRISEKFNTQFFTSTISYMLAYALDRNYTDVRLYGIDMHGKEEYMMQKGGVEYWLGRFMERGAKVFIAPGGAVMQTKNGMPYGFEPKYDFDMIDKYNIMGLRK
jgi:hypothetical protein